MATCTKKIGERGEIVLPKEIREESGINLNQDVEIISSKNGVLILPLVNDIRQLRGLFKKEGYRQEKAVDDVLFRIMAGM